MAEIPFKWTVRFALRHESVATAGFFLEDNMKPVPDNVSYATTYNNDGTQTAVKTTVWPDGRVDTETETEPYELLADCPLSYEYPGFEVDPLCEVCKGDSFNCANANRLFGELHTKREDLITIWEDMGEGWRELVRLLGVPTTFGADGWAKLWEPTKTLIRADYTRRPGLLCYEITWRDRETWEIRKHVVEGLE